MGDSTETGVGAHSHWEKALTHREKLALIESCQQVAEAHLDSLYAEMWDGEGEEDYDDPLQLPGHNAPIEAQGPFCGCTTCVVREVLNASGVQLLRLIMDEVNTQVPPPR